MSAGKRRTRSAGRAWLVSVLGTALAASSVGLASTAGATPPAASLTVAGAGGATATTATPGAAVTATTTSVVAQTGPQQHTLVNTWDSSRFSLTGTPAHPDGWPVDYTTNGGATWLPNAPSDLTTVDGVRSRGSITATAAGNGQALGVSNESSQWFTTTASSSFNASSSGDGWSTFFDETRVFNIHHHNGPNSIDCHELADGTVCAGFPVDLSGEDYYFNTSSRPDGWVDLTDHHLWFPTSNAYSGEVGFACLDVSTDTPALCSTPFVALQGDGAHQDNPIDLARVGSRLYTTDSQTGEMLCLDAAANAGAGAPCADQPFAGFAASDTQGALITVGSNVYAYQDGEDTITCFDATADLACTGWTPPAVGSPGSSARPFLAVPDSSGSVVALCLNGLGGWYYDPQIDDVVFAPATGLSCVSVNDGSAWTPGDNLVAAISANAPGTCCGTIFASAQTVGTKMFWPVETNNTYAICFDVVTDHVCPNWPEQVDSIYTVRVDPYNPLCLFTNGDDGVVRSWDINTGLQSGCGTPPTGDMTADFSSAAASPQLGCSAGSALQGFHSLTLNTPTSGFDSATLSVKDSAGQPVTDWTDVPFTPGTPVDLSGLSVDAVGTTPTFHVTLHNVSTWVDAPDLTLTYTTGQPQLCVPLQVVAPCPAGSGLASSSTVAVDPADISARTSVSLNGGSPTSTDLGATLSGTTYDGSACFSAISGLASVSGLPVSGATVRLLHGSTTLATTQTEADGDYAFALVYAGAYTVSFSDAGHNRAPADQGTVATMGGTETINAVYNGPPPPPVATALVSTGVGVTPQHGDITVPSGDSVALLDGANALQTTVTLASGTYVLDPTSGRVTFTATFGFHGVAPAVRYQLTDADDQTGQATYTPTVQAPEGPSASNLASTDVGVTPQHADVAVPSGGSAMLLDATNTPQTTVTLAGGTYVVDPATGLITYTPLAGFLGASPVRYRVTDAYDQTAQATYTPTVNVPGGPTAAALTSTGTGTAHQSVPVTVPASGTLQLVDAGGVETGSTDATGKYAVEGGTLTFVPVLGFQGTAPGVKYRITDAYGQTAEGSYTPSVSAPAGPSAQALTSTGVGTAAQAATVVKASGDVLVLLDGTDQETTTVTVPAQGTYVLTGTTISFTPQEGFVGVASGVLFRLRDAYGQTSDASYTPTVTAPPVTAPPVAAPTVALGQDGVGNVWVACALPGQRVATCSVVLTTMVHGKPVVIGSRRITHSGQAVITLSPLGQRLLHRQGSLTVKVVATVKPTGAAAVRRTVTTRLHAKALAVPVVHFANASATVPAGSVKALKVLRGKLTAAGVTAVTCVGYTDGRDTSGFNRSLGLARARAVCAIATSRLHLRLTTLSFGETNPVGSNATPAGRAANRRVTLRLAY